MVGNAVAPHLLALEGRGVLTVDRDTGQVRLTATAFARMLGRHKDSLLHFVGFRGDEYLRAARVFGKPDMIHYHHDRRAVADFAPNDTVVFANGCEGSVNPHAVEPEF